MMNETIKTLETRRSVRCFDAERMPSEETIKQVVEAGATHCGGHQQADTRPSLLS